MKDFLEIYACHEYEFAPEDPPMQNEMISRAIGLFAKRNNIETSPSPS